MNARLRKLFLSSTYGKGITRIESVSAYPSAAIPGFLHDIYQEMEKQTRLLTRIADAVERES